jgi:serine/threonine protein kinase
MGTVWRARHETLGRVVAVKELLSSLASNTELRERFKQEAKALALLQHPGIVSLYDYVETPDGAFLVLEFVDGKPLDRHIREVTGPIPAPRAAELMGQALSAFAYAHKEGVVHRDVKPANLMVTPDGRLKVLDFGIAKLVGEADKKLTKTGTKMGTVLYMSPEQVLGHPVDSRSDIYSLGVVLYEMLTGHYPFDVESATEFTVYNHIVREPLPDPRRHYPAIPEAVVRVIERATAKDPKDRYVSCSEFLQDLNVAVLATSAGNTISVPKVDALGKASQDQYSSSRSTTPKAKTAVGKPRRLNKRLKLALFITMSLILVSGVIAILQIPGIISIESIWADLAMRFQSEQISPEAVPSSTYSGSNNPDLDDAAKAEARRRVAEQEEARRLANQQADARRRAAEQAEEIKRAAAEEERQRYEQLQGLYTAYHFTAYALQQAHLEMERIQRFQIGRSKARREAQIQEQQNRINAFVNELQSIEYQIKRLRGNIP